MKIANRHLILVLSLLLGTSIGPGFASAEPAPAVTNPSSPPAETSPKAAEPVADTQAPEVSLPDLPKPMSGDKKEAKDKDPEVKVPDSVKDVIKRLGSKNDDVTLDDLNAAREAVAKLDALIDIEKRLQDLDKIRNERAKEKDKNLVDAIPKTALIPPPSYTQHQPEKRPETPPPLALPPAPVDLDIVNIQGSNSRYGAVIRENGNLRLVHAGDHLSDGSTIVSISTRGVEVERNKTVHLTQIKDVQAVFGASP